MVVDLFSLASFSSDCQSSHIQAERVYSNDSIAMGKITLSEFDKMFVQSIAVFVYTRRITHKRRNESGRKETSSTEIDMFSAITKPIKTST